MLLNEFSAVNLERCLRWHPAGLQSWSMSDWAVALMGEVGEVAEVIDASYVGVVDKDMLAGEIGGVFAYLDLFAQATGLDLLRCVNGPPDPHCGSAWATLRLVRAAGKLCDVVKKLNRCRDGLPGNKLTQVELMRQLEHYICRTMLALDRLALTCGLDMRECARQKINAVSERLGFPERL